MAIPVTIEDARRQIRLEEDDESKDTDLRQFIDDAAAWIEVYTGHILEARDVTETFCGFGVVGLRAWPVKPNAVPGVAYVDSAGAPVAIVGARLDCSGRPVRVLPPSGPFYSFRDAQQVFTVTIRAGYEDAGSVPGNFRRAMLILISAFDSDREGGEVFQKAEAAARRLCGSKRARRL